MPKIDEDAAAEFLRPFEEKGGDIVLTLGLTPVEIGKGRAVMKMPLGPSTSQLMGVFAGGSLISLADITAAVACGAEGGLFPFTVQLSANLLRNTDTGSATAESQVVHAGRAMKVVETIVKDDNDNVLVRVSTTHLISAPRGDKGPDL